MTYGGGRTLTTWCERGVGPRVLVAYASRHGSTREIAAALARGLTSSVAGRRSGLSVTLAPVEQGPDPALFDAVVLGSAVYGGQWIEPAARYAWEMESELRGRSTWLFSSGLTNAPHRLPDEADDARQLGDALGARGHRLFPGRLERRLLSAAERDAWAARSMVVGDFRDWAAARAWWEQIAAEVAVLRAVAPVG